MVTEESIKEHIPTIINVYSTLLGEEFRGIISKRANNLQYSVYEDIESLQCYYDFLIQQKRKELSLKFLKIIGVKPNEVGKDLNSLISQNIDIWNNLLNEYTIYEKTLEPYSKQIEDEIQFKRKIYEEKSEEFFQKAYELLSLEIKTLLDKNNLSIYEFFDSFNVLEEKSNIEYFSQSDNLKLLDDNVSQDEKKNIKDYRKQYFSKILNNSDVDFLSYEDIIENYDVEKIIPSQELAEKIAKLRHNLLKEVEEDYFNIKYDLEQYPRFLKEILCKNMCNKEICITPLPNDLGFFSILFFTYRIEEHGTLDYVILHEFFHQISLILDENKFYCCFDILPATDEDYIETNRYNTNKRKYEILSENIIDIFALSALDILHNNGIYMFENKSITKNMNEIEYCNSSSITLDLLTPFVDKYKMQLVKVFMFNDTNQLFSEIGKENFEMLNDTINKLDYIIDVKKLRNIDSIEKDLNNDADINEFNNLLKKVEQIYNAMSNYKINSNQPHNTNNNPDFTDSNIEL